MDRKGTNARKLKNVSVGTKSYSYLKIPFYLFCFTSYMKRQ